MEQIIERKERKLPISKSATRTKDRAFYYRSFFRLPSSFDEGGRVHYLLYKKSNDDAGTTICERKIQTMKSKKDIYNDPYRFSPTHLYSTKTKIESKVDNNRTKRDTYISISSFWGNSKSRTIEYIKEVDRIVIDIDAANHITMSLKEKKELANNIQNKLGKADFINDSGRGIQIIYLFAPETKIYAIKKSYTDLVDSMCKVVESIIPDGYSVDRLGLNSYYRLPKTYNSKSKTKTKVLEYNEYKELDYCTLCTLFGIVPYKEKKTSSKKKKKKTSSNTGKSEVSLNNFSSNMHCDYLKLISYTSVGFRNKLIYAYIYNIQCSVKSYEKLIELAANLNGNFSKPLPPYEIKSIVKSAVRQYRNKGVVYSFRKQLKWIGIDESLLQQEDFLNPINDDEYRERVKNSKKRYNDRQKEKRSEKKKEIILRANKLATDGKKISEIMTILSLSRNTVKKYLQYQKAD